MSAKAKKCRIFDGRWALFSRGEDSHAQKACSPFLLPGLYRAGFRTAQVDKVKAAIDDLEAVADWEFNPWRTRLEGA
jgi:hypothetical protein